MSPVSTSPITSTTNGVNLNGHAVKKHLHGFGTRAIHVGSDPSAETGAVIPPISLSTTYKQDAIGVHKVRTSFLMWTSINADLVISH